MCCGRTFANLIALLVARILITVNSCVNCFIYMAASKRFQNCCYRIKNTMVARTEDLISDINYTVINNFVKSHQTKNFSNGRRDNVNNPQFNSDTINNLFSEHSYVFDPVNKIPIKKQQIPKIIIHKDDSTKY
jgi:hypothetical protein